jgi:predicted RNase H-like nuclease
VAGIDGVGPRWVAAIVTFHAEPAGPGHDPDRRWAPAGVEWRVGTAAEVLDLARTCEAVAMDVPIGFVRRGPRSSETEARTLLGRDRSSVFPTPPVPAWTVARTLGVSRGARAMAQEASRQAGGSGISAQAWGIAPKILEVEDAIRSLPPGAAARVVETHPETAFRVLGEGPWPGKRSAAGVARRLRRLGVDLPGLDDTGLTGVPVDDAVDALAAAWTAARVAEGTAVTLGVADAAGAVWSDGSPAPGRAVIVV